MSRWVTLSNHRRVLLDEDGRIRQGLPEMFHDVHVHDVAPLSKRVREAENHEAECERSVRRRRGPQVRTPGGGGPRPPARKPRPCRVPRARVRHPLRCVRRVDQERPARAEATSDVRRRAVRRDRGTPLDLGGKRAISSRLPRPFDGRRPAVAPLGGLRGAYLYLADATGLAIQLPRRPRGAACRGRRRGDALAGPRRTHG